MAICELKTIRFRAVKPRSDLALTIRNPVSTCRGHALRCGGAHRLRRCFDLSTLLVAGVALFASVLGGVAGYGTGALMPLVLVPMVGAEQVVPIIALAGNDDQHRPHDGVLRFVDWHRAWLVMIGAMPPCLITAYGYTLLTGKGAQLVIGGMLMLTVPLRYMLRRRAVVLSDRGLLLGLDGYGAAVGGTVGAGVILLSLLMAAGLAGAGGDRDRRHAVDLHRRRAARGVRPRRRDHGRSRSRC